MPVSSCNSSVISCTSSCKSDKQKRSKKHKQLSNSFICRFCHDISLTTSCHPFLPSFLSFSHPFEDTTQDTTLHVQRPPRSGPVPGSQRMCFFFGAFNIIRKLFPRSTPPRNSQLRLSLEKANGENSPEPAAPQPQQLQLQRHHLAEKS